jgi:ABC-type glutathione transport system ATPase component
MNDVGPQRPHTATPAPPPQILSARGVVKTYHTGTHKVPALRGIDLDVHVGELVTVMGPSGNGKTTLLNCLSGLDDIDADRLARRTRRGDPSGRGATHRRVATSTSARRSEIRNSAYVPHDGTVYTAGDAEVVVRHGQLLGLLRHLWTIREYSCVRT